jgi:hypothetical protein
MKQGFKEEACMDLSLTAAAELSAMQMDFTLRTVRDTAHAGAQSLK